MFADVLNPIVTKKSIKENWKIKKKISKKNRFQVKNNFKWWKKFRIREKNSMKIASKTIYKKLAYF